MPKITLIGGKQKQGPKSLLKSLILCIPEINRGLQSSKANGVIRGTTRLR